MSFLVVPAIDLMNGGVVRLHQGRYDQATRYAADPARTAAQFYQAGARWLHVVDLDAARSPAFRNDAAISAIIAAFAGLVQVAGGVRSEATAATLLRGGAARVLLGTAAVEDPQLVRRLLREYGPDQIGVSLDLLRGVARVRGWLQSSSEPPRAVVDRLLAMGLGHLVITSTGRDGTLEGPEWSLYRDLPPGLSVWAAGGVSSVEDLVGLRRLGIAGAIVGRAHYEGRVPIQVFAEGGLDACQADHSLPGREGRPGGQGA